MSTKLKVCRARIGVMPCHELAEAPSNYCFLHFDYLRPTNPERAPAKLKVKGPARTLPKRKARRNPEHLMAHCPDCGAYKRTTNGMISFHYFETGCWRTELKLR